MVDLVGPLIVVENEKTSRAFYEKLLSQKIKFDLGACQQFVSGLTLQRKSSMTEIFGIPQEAITLKSNSCVLYFETNRFDSFIQNLREYDLEYIHDVVEFDWGQRSISFYDPDGHSIDVSETMESVCKRFLAQGMSIEEVAKRTEHPIDFIKSCV